MSSDSAASPSFAEIQERMKNVQKGIMEWARAMSGQDPLIDQWQYTKGTGGGTTIVWESDDTALFFEKGGVNWSGLTGHDLPTAASSQLNIPPHTEYRVTGVSLVMHPHNPQVPTIHMNVRYFEADVPDLWWFGGGIDVTPVYPQFDQAVAFHRELAALCARHDQPYDDYKKQCDEYFFLKHRGEARGIGGIFFDNLGPRQRPGCSRTALLDFVTDLGHAFTRLYQPFTANHALPYTAAQREFQLWRRSRYVEFNLLWDRGTKFGIQSEGRTESILMSMPAVCTWKYCYSPPAGSPEARLLTYLQPQDWLQLADESQMVGATP